ncbi:MAG: ABC transporter ATP-binding protein, partial [Clostridiales bacterium]|nr:ABC transporter ATP-binding protein [Clostridiales bacterium]
MKKGGRPKASKGVFGRVLKLLFKFYPVLVPVTIFCILFSAAAAAVPDVFIQNVIAVIDKYSPTGDWSAAGAELMPKMIILIVLYILSLAATTIYTQFMAFITQGSLNKMRKSMFNGMQNLPIKYFDTNKHGDIMSHYTNDIDTLRQLISQALPSLLRAGSVVICVFFVMIYYSLWMTLVLLLGVAAMMFVTKKVGGGSAKYFLRQQQSLGRAEGFAQEMMNGQKVIKVFSHESECEAEFDEINNALCDDSCRANAYANILGPIIGNIGNVLYVVVAVAGGIFLLTKIPNVSISRAALDISIVVPFLNMTKQFTGNVNQLSQQINAIVMGLAGAERIFELVDEEPEADNGYVTLVNV